MKNENINKEWLIKPTGDPFADVGGYVIEYLQQREPDKSILELIEDIAKLYVHSWDAKLNAFFLNSKITQAAFKTDKKISETIKYFSNLINNKEQSVKGHCRLSGQNTYLFQAGRDNSILSGSGTFVNFHHFFQEGIMLSKEMLIRMYFVPLGTVSIQGRIAVIKSNIHEVTKHYVFENVRNNLHKVGTNTEDVGVIKSEFSNPANALFSFVDDVIYKAKLYNENQQPISLSLLHFTNFGASPEVTVYILPALVFRFYSICTRGEYLKDWNYFVRSHYYNSGQKGALYNPKSDCFELEKKGNINSTSFEDYKSWTNFIYKKLLSGESILKEFLRWSRKHKMNIKIIEAYQINIGQMKKETIQKIKQMADFITQSENEDVIKKSIRALDGARNPAMLRRFIIKGLIAENYKNNNEEPIVSLEDYTNYLFPDGNSWQEIRDMLIIAIYQKMHELNLNIEIELEEELENQN